MEMHEKYSVLEDLEVPQYASSTERVERIERLVMEKMAAGRRKTAVKRRILLAVAVAAACALTVAAGYFSASDAFRGFLKEPGAAELSSTAPVVDRTGALLDLGQPMESAGIRVTPKAVAGDESTFAILFELETTDGSPIGLQEADGGHSDGSLIFRSSRLSAPGIEPDRWSYRAMETKVSGSKATVLQRFDLFRPVPMGETVHVELGQLQQQANLPGQETGLQGQDLYDAVGKFSATGADSLLPVSEGGFTGTSGASSLYPEPGDVYLDRDGGQAVPLAAALEGYALTNALLHDGTLYLSGTATAAGDVMDRIARSALVAADGRVIERDIIRVYDRPSVSDVAEWWVTFKGILSLDELKELRWLVDHGFSMYDHSDGSWEFDMVIDYDIISVEKAVGRPMSLEGHAGALETLRISPYRLTFDFVPDDRSAASFDAVQQEWFELTVELRDGGQIEPSIQDIIPVHEIPGDESSPMTAVRCYFELREVIDPAQVTAVHCGQQSYAVG